MLFADTGTVVCESVPSNELILFSRRCVYTFLSSAFFLHHRSKRQWQVQRDRLHAVRVWIQSSEDSLQEAVGSDPQF